MFDTRSLRAIEKALDASALRQRVYANDIANVDTPGYKRSHVDFEASLQNALGESEGDLVGFRTDPRHMQIGQPSTFADVQPTVVLDNSSSLTNNGNNVDIDAEMSEVAKNQMTYDALVKQMDMQFSMLKNVITGGQ